MQLLSTAYFPPIQYYSKLVQENPIYIECFENYAKQSYRNRCDILGANGRLTLSVPVLKGARKKILTKDIQIEYVENWQKIHFQGIESAYRKSPYYEYYIDDIEPIFNKDFKYLIDLNEHIMSIVNEIIEINPQIERTTDYIKDTSGYIDWREGIHPKKSKRLEDENYTEVAYTQVFSDKFEYQENLSILDLIFNLGPESLIHLNKTIKTK
ncbi:hypothetical protein E0494_09320 [Marinilabiliaceae bacterium JC040]|nr:hypothetical protein [Marinilabiliaceae bacterium JC040]